MINILEKWFIGRIYLQRKQVKKRKEIFASFERNCYNFFEIVDNFQLKRCKRLNIKIKKYFL